MSRKWNGKALVDELATRLWDCSNVNKERIIGWINEIQDDIVSEMPVDFYKFKLKKLFPLTQEIIDVNIQVPYKNTVTFTTGGSFDELYHYRAMSTFVVFDEDLKTYMESEPSIPDDNAFNAPTSGNQQLVISAVDVMDGDTSVKPATIWRNIYIQKKLIAATTWGEPFLMQVLKDNTSTSTTILAPTTSTISPPSASEIDQVASDNPYNLSSGKYLERQDMDDLRRYNPTGSASDTPSYYDYVGTDRLFLYPKLSSAATTAQRTFNYFVHRRPHEAFYTLDRPIDLPITFKMALIEGVLWKGYEFRDRDGHVTKLNNYEKFKAKALNKIRRLKNRPSVVRDVVGDTFGYEV